MQAVIVAALPAPSPSLSPSPLPSPLPLQLERMYVRGQAPVVSLYSEAEVGGRDTGGGGERKSALAGRHRTLHAFTSAPPPSRQLLAPRLSRGNVIIELAGTDKAAEVVVIGGHIDSWDVAEGAIDDGGGVAASWGAVRLLKQLGLRPRRTIRAVAFVNEENGLRGGTQYALDHLAELNRTSLGEGKGKGVGGGGWG